MKNHSILIRAIRSFKAGSIDKEMLNYIADKHGFTIEFLHNGVILALQNDKSN